MQTLTRLSASKEAAWYQVGGDYQGEVERYVVSTPGTRTICNRSELLGVEFNKVLHDAMAAALREAPFRDFITAQPEERVCVVNFLRGGLNFELRRAINAAYGFNRHSSAFMSSQRERVDGRWRVREDMYRKLEIPEEAVLVVGDVVATGVTLGNGFDVIVDHVKQIGSSLKGLILFTIGCHKSEKILEDLHARLVSEFPGYERTAAVYLEGKFRLVDSRTGFRVGIPGTDLVRHDTQLAPEYELSLYESLTYPLERCVIYDAGSRAFDVPRYVSDVVEYWEQVRGFGKRGWTLGEAIRERWPAPEYENLDTLRAAKAETWIGVEDELIVELFERHRARWNGAEGEMMKSAKALRKLAEERLAELARAAGGAV